MASAASDEHPDLLFYERRARQRGCVAVAGIDEVGRGALAGPVVAAAVILPLDTFSLAVTDSKMLSASRREALAADLLGSAGVHVGIGVVSHERIDEINILNATHQAMRQALQALPVRPALALVDGCAVPNLPVPAEFIVKGDSLSASIAAASILAKVHRDALMADLDLRYPEYGFGRHKGYGTGDHLAALRQFGCCPIHRRSFAPVARVGDPHVQPELPFDAF